MWIRFSWIDEAEGKEENNFISSVKLSRKQERL